MTVPNVVGRDISELLAPQGAPRQPMQGFEPVYADIVDYILRCTHRIWEQKNIGLVQTHYGPDCRMHLMTGPIDGADGVIANTVRTLAAFPDRTLMGEAVIWSDEAPATYLSSHRITSSGTNLGPSDFGPATGRRVSFTTIADCLCRENKIIEEWLVRDNSALVIALGLSPRVVAREHARTDREADSRPAEWRVARMEEIRGAPIGCLDPRPFPPPQHSRSFAAFFFEQIWNQRCFGRAREIYSPAIRFEGPGGRPLFGHGEVIGWCTALIACFSDARFTVDHVASVADEHGREIAVRWSMTGTHDGVGIYGAPSNRAIYILAVTHWRMIGTLIVHEVTIFDEVALLRQIEGGL